MTEKEIQNLLNLLDKKGLEETRRYLIEEKDIIKENKKINTFDDYITNKGIKPDRINSNGTYYYDDTMNLVFTNGISIYYVNPKLAKLFEPVILRHRLNKIQPQWHHRINLMNEVMLKSFKNKIDSLEDNFALAEFLSTNSRYSFIHTFSSQDGNAKFDFSSREIEHSDIILDEPKYEIGIHSPVLRAENELGKVYILGLHPKNN